MHDEAALRDPIRRGSATSTLAPPPRRTVTSSNVVQRVLPLYDAAVAITAIIASHRVWAGRTPAGAYGVLVIAVLAPMAWVAVFQFFRAYSPTDVTGGDEIRRTLGASATASFALGAIANRAGLPVTMSILIQFFVATAAAELLGRWLARSLSARSRRTGTAAAATLVIGTNAEARQLARRLSASPSFEPLGFIGSPTGDDGETELPIVGALHETEAVLRRTGAACVYVASSALSTQEIETIARACRRTSADLHISTNVSGIHPSRLIVRSTGGFTALSVKHVRLSGSQAALKRTFDVIVGSALLALALPFIAVIGAAIRLTSPGPAFFRQTRITKDGRPFTMYKFRSMVVDPERALQGTLIDLTKPFFKLEDDPRLTPIGRVIRSLSIDELPQLWNVVNGDMSLVGPRPLPAEQVAANADFLAPRHEVRGGLTGLWQVSGRSELDSEEALRIDRFYIENWSLGLDLWILYRTLGAVVARRGAV